MRKFIKFCLLPILLLGISESAIAQKKHRQRARTAIKELKEGTLIVLIPTFQRKIDTLKSLLKRNISKKDRSFLTKKLNKAEKDRDLAPMQIQESFNLYYDFSEVLFINDTSGTHLKNGNYANIFLNQKTPIDLEGKNFFVHKPSVLRTSSLIRDATTDKNFIPLEPPFPHVFTRNSIIDFSGLKEKSLIGERYVQIMNSQLWTYHGKADKRKWWHFITREWKK